MRHRVRLCVASPMLAAAAAFVVSGPAASQAGEKVLTLATTTSTHDTGLLGAVLPDFERRCGCRVDVVAVGTGQALELGRRGDADIVLVHARQQEDQFVAAGHGKRRDAVMYNDFVIVGPDADPAAVGTKARARDALKAIADAKAPFASRGDKSGTHAVELALWKAAGIAPSGAMPWYLSVGQGMGVVLMFAGERRAYALSDRATWLSMQRRLPSLRLLFGGESIASNPDRSLRNEYGVIEIDPARRPSGRGDLASRFVTWLLSKPTQERIGAFGRDTYGQPLFYPDSDEFKSTRTLTVTVGAKTKSFTLDDLKRLPKITLVDHEVVGVKRGPLGRKSWGGAPLKDVLLAVDPTLAKSGNPSQRIVLVSSDGWKAVIKWAELFGTVSAGEALYNVKGCNECHGTEAEGSSPQGKAAVPALRNRPFDLPSTLSMINGGVGPHAGIDAYTPQRLNREELSAVLAWLASPEDGGTLPRFSKPTDKQSVLLCYEVSGRPMTGADGLIQLVVGVDEFASRYSHWVAQVRVE